MGKETLDKILTLLEEGYYKDTKKQLDVCSDILINLMNEYQTQRSRYLRLNRKYNDVA